jgi:prolipoprotein diacylglyceryl transferase
MGLLASIPSPGSNAIHLGPLQVRAYGLMIALGVLAAVWLASRRAERFAVASRDDISHIATWAVPAGVIGARIYHIVTDWELFRDDPVRMLRVWEGGLGIPGGMALGVLVGVWRARKRLGRVGPILTVATPALPLAQAVGRLGNWWNQELFGRPTSLPWGLRIDPAHRPDRYAAFTTFQPTFLYEALGNLLLCVGIIWLTGRLRLRPGRVFCLYVLGYGLLRLAVESLRTDFANTIAGLRVNTWVSMLLIAGGGGFLIWDRWRNGPVTDDELASMSWFRSVRAAATETPTIDDRV